MPQRSQPKEKKKKNQCHEALIFFLSKTKYSVSVSDMKRECFLSQTMKKHGIKNDDDGDKENMDVKRPRKDHKDSSMHSSMVSEPTTKSAFAFVPSTITIHCHSS
jgi:hypothetical protein